MIATTNFDQNMDKRKVKKVVLMSNTVVDPSIDLETVIVYVTKYHIRMASFSFTAFFLAVFCVSLLVPINLRFFFELVALLVCDLMRFAVFFSALPLTHQVRPACLGQNQEGLFQKFVTNNILIIKLWIPLYTSVRIFLLTNSQKTH